jgi:hypothetical protein
MSGANSWLARQRKSDLVELAQTVGLKECVLLSTFPINFASRKLLGSWDVGLLFSLVLMHLFSLFFCVLHASRRGRCVLAGREAVATAAWLTPRDALTAQRIAAQPQLFGNDGANMMIFI